MKNDFEQNLETLSLLSEALTMPNSLEEGIQHITTMTCTLMETKQAVFLTRDEERKELIVQAAVGIDSPNVKPGHRLLVPQRLHNILWQSHHLHQIGKVEAGIEGIIFPILTIPITVKGARVGLLIAGGTLDRDAEVPYNAIRRKLFTLIAPFASLAIENAKIYDYLRQSTALQSKELRDAIQEDAQNKRDESAQLMVSSIRNPTKVVNKLTETFFRQLAETGFTVGQLTDAAAHILECITLSDIDRNTGKVTFVSPENN